LYRKEHHSLNISLHLSFLSVSPDLPILLADLGPTDTVTMSDPTTEPGAPAAGTNSDIPPAQEKSMAAEAKKRAPPRLLQIAATPDRLMLRLNKYALSHRRNIQVRRT